MKKLTDDRVSELIKISETYNLRLSDLDGMSMQELQTISQFRHGRLLKGNTKKELKENIISTDWL